MNIDSGDESYLLKSIKEGTALLILGAGASASSRNSKGNPIKVGRQLAKPLAESAGQPYVNESLTDVLGAVRGQILSDVQIKNILIAEYKGIVPSDELQNIFRLVWKRLYTLNIDDAVENCTHTYGQRRRYYNGMIDKAAEFEPLDVLHVVHLHGDIAKPEHHFILTEPEYAKAIKSETHFWYQRFAQDYLAHCPIFIGSTIDEPILAAELERAKRESGVSGKAFLITPDSLSPIKAGSLKSKGIVHIKANLEDFSKWLQSKLPSGTSPANIVAESNRYPPSLLDTLTKHDLHIASYIRPIIFDNLKTAVNNKSPSDVAYLARQFLRGFPASWMVAASDIPVILYSSKTLFSKLSDAIEQSKNYLLSLVKLAAAKRPQL